MKSHSESGKLKSVFIKRAKDAFIDDAHISKHWEALNYLGKTEINKALAEYEAFEQVFKDNGTEIFYLPHDATVNMDSIYCRDAAIATAKGMIICNMGKEGRKNEPLAEQKAFEGIRQITELLKPLGVNVISVPMPHYKGPSDVFHLMSVLSPVDNNLAVVYSPLIPIVFRNELIKRGYELVEVPDTEFDSMGCNVLALAPRVCLMVKGNPITKERLEKAGCKVIEYEGAEISVKGGGGPTCLTRPVERV